MNFICGPFPLPTQFRPNPTLTYLIIASPPIPSETLTPSFPSLQLPLPLSLLSLPRPVPPSPYLLPAAALSLPTSGCRTASPPFSHVVAPH